MAAAAPCSHYNSICHAQMQHYELDLRSFSITPQNLFVTADAKHLSEVAHMLHFMVL